MAPPVLRTVQNVCLNSLKPLLLAMVAGGSLAVASCTPNADPEAAPPQAERLKVTTTIFPVYLFTSAVAGDAAEVQLLVPPGSEVHDYQSKPADVQQLAQAQVLVKNGLGLETFLDSTLQSAQNTDLVQVDASQGVETLAPEETTVITQEDHDHGEEGGEGHDHGEANPHVWLDPVRAQRQVENIRDGLIQADPQNRSAYERNAATYIQRLQQLDQQFSQRLQRCRQQPCTFIAFHDAFPYLANRYGLRQVAIVEIPEDTLSPGDLQRTMTIAQQNNVKALLSEPGVSNPALTNLAQDLNLTLRTLDPLESGPTDPQYYFTAMEKNLETLDSSF
jgi:zinc transport system substrate-binding protein